MSRTSRLRSETFRNFPAPSQCEVRPIRLILRRDRAMPSTTLVVHQRERHMKEPMGRSGSFYLGSAAVLLLVVIVGFAPTFYLRAAFGAPEFSWRGGAPALSWSVFVHG